MNILSILCKQVNGHTFWRQTRSNVWTQFRPTHQFTTVESVNTEYWLAIVTCTQIPHTLAELTCEKILIKGMHTQNGY